MTIWAVSDGRAGIENQVMGLAEAVARLLPADIAVKRIRFDAAFDRWPTALKLWPNRMLAADSDRIEAPWPDIWIAAGRATLPFSLRMKKRSNGRTLVVQLQDPKENLSAFDLVIAPEHDEVKGGNVLSLLGSTNRITPNRLTDEAAGWRDRLSSLPRPHVAVLVGGKSKTHDLTADRARAIAHDIREAVGTGSLLLTLSRRTPDDARAIFHEVLGDLPGLIYDGQGDNPYFAVLDAADYILVTEDSVNMVAEAAVTGKPVYRLAMDRLRPEGKFARFHQALEERGIVRPFEGKLDTWTYAPLNETARAATKVVEVFSAKHSS
ncbi:nucleoside-diphosphate sugar epimerase [Asticcacaulis sp. AC460]|uniref:mitochondrial fission ELM1 family protein n=1 Tax=Asticcacaulis sp. AC460 TaxID=1282360 RepID=UPI0003C40162|nr:nucleoside-diphosphate sugar epimerase [Asticcacaulis sp. AC460]